MAKIIIDNIEYEVADGSPVAEIAEKHGIPFSCNSGVCATCQIEILEGAENFADLNQEEKDLGMDEKHRLSCQCILKCGTAKVTY